jgi:3-dehydroquinate synthetase
MVMAADLSARLGGVAGRLRALRALIERAGLPVRAPDLGRERWLS